MIFEMKGSVFFLNNEYAAEKSRDIFLESKLESIISVDVSPYHSQKQHVGVGWATELLFQIQRVTAKHETSVETSPNYM